MENAISRALEIFKIVFESKPDLYFFNHIIYDDSDIGYGSEDVHEVIENIADSYKQELIERGLDLVFSTREKGKPFYNKLKPYLLKHGIKRMSDTFE